MEISASLVKDLRDKTGAGMMDCKKALSEAGGEFDKAMTILRERGIAKAASKEGRATSEGLIVTAQSGNTASMVEINCETDFVARTDQFKGFVNGLAELIVAKVNGDGGKIQTGDSVAEQAVDGKTFDLRVKEVIAGVGENIQFKRFVKYEGNGYFATYIHPGDKLGVLVDISRSGSGPAPEDLKMAARDVAMHIAATSPAAVRRDEVDPTMIENERAIFRKQAENDKKPANIIEKIVDGRIEKYYAEIVLLEQPFVKDNDKTVGDLLKETGAKIGETVGINRFTRFRLGE